MATIEDIEYALASGQGDEPREVPGRCSALVPHAQEEVQSERMHFVEVEEERLECRRRRVCVVQYDQYELIETIDEYRTSWLVDSPVLREQVGHFIRRLRDRTSPLFRPAQLFLYDLRPIVWVPFHEVFLGQHFSIRTTAPALPAGKQPTKQSKPSTPTSLNSWPMSSVSNPSFRHLIIVTASSRSSWRRLFSQRN